MAKIISEREHHEKVEYFREFERKDAKGSYFSFPSDEFGNVDESVLKPEALKNWHKCISSVYDVTDCGVVGYTHTWTDPAVLQCDCGEEVFLERFTNTCNQCGIDYNMSGQQLAPREQWGEETGEHWTDCI